MNTQNPHTDPPTPSLLKLQCPSCGAKMVFHSWEEKLVCQYCGSEQILLLPTRGSEKADAGARPVIPKPNRVEVRRGKNDSLELRYRWFSWKVFPMAFFAIFWDGFLCLWYMIALSSSSVNWIMVLFPILHLAIGIGITYYVIASFLNTTTITVDKQWFKVQHDPVPWPGEVKAPVGNIEQFYCQQRIKTSRDSTTVTYKLNAVMKDGTKKELLSNLDAPEIAGYMEQVVEKFLGIEDRRIQGEFN